MLNRRRAERSLAESDMADSATRGAAFWVRNVAAGVSAVAMIALAVVLFVRGFGVLSIIPLLAAATSVRKLLHARREEKRTFAAAVETMQESRRPD